MDAQASAAPETRAASAMAGDLVLRWVKAWAAAVVVLALVGVAGGLISKPWSITDYFFYSQDLPATGLSFMLFAGLLAFAGATRLPTWAQPEVRPRWAFAAAAAVTVACWAGARLVQANYALSGDEFMAQFDAKILGTGRLAAPVPQAWQGYEHALQPAFLISGAHHWVSGYLPVNAAFLALGSALGSQSLIPALWTGISVIAAYGVARRLWPERRAAAPVAALLLASAPQVIVTGMTPFAMSAHLAANLVWLWLVLRGGRLGHGLAIAVAFLACGLHQLAFFPLFAGPFVLQMWLEGRRRAALLHTIALAAVLAFWNFYPAIRLAWLQTSGAAEGRAGSAVDTAMALLGRFGPDGVGLMAKNLFRFTTWQSLLTVPILLLAAPAAWRARGAERALILGIGLTTVTMFVIIPFQGHGWGYRYLHGLSGSAALLAAWGWSRAIETWDAEARRRAHGAMVASILASACVLTPLRAWQAHDFVRPYAETAGQLLASGADVLVIDDTGMWYGAVLLRNDPFFKPPVMLYLPNMSSDQVRQVCARHAVKIYGGEKFGPVNPAKPRLDPHVAELRRLMADLNCGHPLR